MTDIVAIVGLGNPGEKYSKTRHNAGFWLCDELVRRHGGSFKSESKLHGEMAQVTIAGQPIRLLKPDTFMNKSGNALVALAQYFKLKPAQILVVHDEIDLPPGAAKLKQGGGHGGHNGLRDIIRHVGNDFPRLRLGVGHPGRKEEVINYVLKAAGSDEQRQLDDMLERASDIIPQLIENGMEAAMLKLHTKS